MNCPRKGWESVKAALRHGCNAAARCLFFTTIDDRPNRVGVRPASLNGFTDEEVTDLYRHRNGPGVHSGRRPMHTECWVAIGPDSGAEYAGQNGALHTFSTRDAGCLMIGIGSTRAGARAELNAAREGQELPRQRQLQRYDKVARRAPCLIVEGHPLLEEIAALIPQFMESLKTGFVLMRALPHTGAICGRWDQNGGLSTHGALRDDFEMTPRCLEHWLHQVALDGQIFHVSDVDLSPAVLYKRWDLDDFMYLIAAAQWIAHRDDRAMLLRLAAKCTHMLRVMLEEADPVTGLIASRGIFPDWPPMEVGRTGITYPALSRKTDCGTRPCAGGKASRPNWVNPGLCKLRFKPRPRRFGAASPSYMWTAKAG